MKSAIDVENIRAQLMLARKYAVSPMPGQDVKFAISRIDPEDLNRLIEGRLAAQTTNNQAESDRIRDELAAMGITLKDSKDPATGDAVTRWEVSR